MPSVSASQARLMAGVAHNPDFARKVGIPQSVGKEFTAKDTVESPQVAAGVIFVAPDSSVLLLCRSEQEANYGGFWALPGGKGEDNETPWETACREACEEIGAANRHAWLGEPTIVDEVATPNGMMFTTFVQPVRYRFVPEIDAEHCGYVWCKPGNYPSPMHPQVERVLGALFPEGYEYMADIQANDSLAMDRATVRSIDSDGHMKVSRTPITKAVVSPYLGREIPQWQTLGLDPERVYQIYRDADELAKAAKTFEGKPVLSDHIASSADNHPKLATVGAIGSPVEMVGDTLYAPLTIWDQSAIDDIESEEKRNLSCSYRYTYDPTPGTTPAGMPFDGRMIAIAANHVALVENPRVPGSIVADNMPAGLTATSPNSGVPAAASKRAAAQDNTKENEMADKAAKDRSAKDEDPKAALMEMLKSKLSEDEYDMVADGIEEMMKAKKAEDEDMDDDKKAKDAEAEEKAEVKEKAEDEEEKEEKVTKTAMDSALRSALANERKAQAAIRDAERFVRPWVGDLAVAYDSAESIYKAAIEMQGRSVNGVDPSAYRTILELLPKPGAARTASPRVAMDSKSAASFAERFPDAAKIRLG